jgi:hypothetical protein
VEAGTYPLKETSSSLVMGETSSAFTLSSTGVADILESPAHPRVPCR